MVLRESRSSEPRHRDQLAIDGLDVDHHPRRSNHSPDVGNVPVEEVKGIGVRRELNRLWAGR
jgi:hypothetical protein